MSLERFLEPVSDSQPCGPDLEAADDGAFIDYYFDAIDRMPENYVNQATGEIFDRRAIRINDEVKAIEALLGRTRDLRLIAIGAQFACLAGRPGLVADYADLMAGLLESHWEHVHPRIRDGDPVERCNALELLDSTATMAVAIEHAPLIQDRRLDYITLRRYLVASGQRQPREDEATGDASALITALGSAENAEQVDAVHAALTRLRDALQRIETVCRQAGADSFVPNFGRIKPQLDRLLALLHDARPDLAGNAGPSADVTAETGGEAQEGEPQAAQAAPASPAVATAGTIRNRAHARAALTAVEAYFVNSEPSSPALLLVRQSLELFGKPLVEALRLLLPEKAGQARIDFGSDSAFLIGMERMQQLSAPVEPAADDGADIPEVVVDTRDQAAAMMTAVEGFFRQTEPSSPIPTLLFKARGYLSRDFSALLAELFPAG